MHRNVHTSWGSDLRPDQNSDRSKNIFTYTQFTHCWRPMDGTRGFFTSDSPVRISSSVSTRFSLSWTGPLLDRIVQNLTRERDQPHLSHLFGRVRSHQDVLAHEDLLFSVEFSHWLTVLHLAPSHLFQFHLLPVQASRRFVLHSPLG